MHVATGGNHRVEARLIHLHEVGAHHVSGHCLPDDPACRLVTSLGERARES